MDQDLLILAEHIWYQTDVSLEEPHIPECCSKDWALKRSWSRVTQECQEKWGILGKVNHDYVCGLRVHLTGRYG